MSWAQQRQAIKLAAEAGVRARTSAAGSETLPLTHHHLRYAMLSRPNGDRNQPLIREGPNDYIMLRGGAKKLLRSLQPNGNYQLTKLGRHFFKDKWVDWVVHVPVIIRAVRRNGRNRGMPYERTKRLPVTDLNVALSRQSEGLSDAQAARNLKASVLAQLGNPEPNDIILELSDESYYLDATREWTFSQQAMQVVDDQVVVDTVLDQPLGALRDVSYQLFCGDEILESAFEQRPDKLCVARQLAELMRRPVQEVLSDFDAITNGSKWREQGITPREIRSFCVWRQAPMFYVDCQGRLLDKFEPAIKEQRAVAFTSWNGHAFFYKSARTVARCEPIGDRAQAKYRGERKAGETPEFKDWREWEGEVGSGHFYTEDLEQVRRELLAGEGRPEEQAAYEPRRELLLDEVEEAVALGHRGVPHKIPGVERREVAAAQVPPVRFCLRIGVAGELERGVREDGGGRQGRPGQEGLDHGWRHVGAHQGLEACIGADREVPLVGQRLGQEPRAGDGVVDLGLGPRAGPVLGEGGRELGVQFGPRVERQQLAGHVALRLGLRVVIAQIHRARRGVGDGLVHFGLRVEVQQSRDDLGINLEAVVVAGQGRGDGRGHRAARGVVTELARHVGRDFRLVPIGHQLAGDEGQHLRLGPV